MENAALGRRSADAILRGVLSPVLKITQCVLLRYEKVHCPAAREKENVLHSLPGNEAHVIISASHAPLANRIII
jgi:hypothetical protein